MSRPIVPVKKSTKNSRKEEQASWRAWSRKLEDRWLNTPRRRTWSLFLLVTVIFGLITFLYIHPAITSCSSTILGGGPGDGTAGLTWLTWIDQHSPVPGFTHLTNAPFGESLRQPFQITSIFTLPTMWVLAQLTSAVCAWNLMVYLGYMSSALVMFAFIRWLTRNNFVAFFAGFAVTYTPYHQFNSLGHISYMFSGFFVLIIWAFLAFWRRPSTWNSILLATAMAACAYVDGYFILLSLTLAFSLAIGALLSFKFAKTTPVETLAKLKGMFKVFCIFVIFLLPILLVQLKYSSRISSILSSSRDSIAAESQVYSARYFEYFLPADNDPLLPKSYGLFRQRIIHGSNFTESTLYVGFSVLALAVAAVLLTFRYKRQEKFAGYSGAFLIGILALPLVVAFLLSLEPRAVILHHKVPFPSYFVIHVTQMWRVFSRLFLVVDTCLVIIAALGLYLLIRNWRPMRQLLAVILVVAIVGTDFLTSSAGAVWKYASAPGVYRWLASQQSIHIIAEYPLGDPPSQDISNYLTYQQIDSKARFNTSRSDSPQRPLHLSVAGLGDPQTLPVLRRLGIDTVLSHGSPATLPGLSYLRMDASTRHDYTYDQIWTYKVLPGDKADYAVVALTGFHAPTIDKSKHSYTGMGSHGVLVLQNLDDNKASQVNVDLLANSTGSPTLISVAQNGVVRWQGTVDHATDINFNADPRLPIDVIPYQALSVETIQIYNMQAHL